MVIWGEGEVGIASGEVEDIWEGTKLASSPRGPPTAAANWSQPDQRWVARALEGEV